MSLLLSRQWAEYVYDQSQVNGWESFVIDNRHQGTITYLQMPSSQPHQGIHIYQGSYNKRLEAGIRLSRRDAMYLAVQYKQTRPELYREWSCSR